MGYIIDRYGIIEEEEEEEEEEAKRTENIITEQQQTAQTDLFEHPSMTGGPYFF